MFSFMEIFLATSALQSSLVFIYGFNFFLLWLKGLCFAACDYGEFVENKLYFIPCFGLSYPNHVNVSNFVNIALDFNICYERIKC